MRKNSILQGAGISALIFFSLLLLSSCGRRDSGQDRPSRERHSNRETQGRPTVAETNNSSTSRAWESYEGACAAIALFEEAVISSKKESLSIGENGTAAKARFFTSIRDLPVFSKDERVRELLNKIDATFLEASKNSPNPDKPKEYLLLPTAQLSIQGDCAALKSTIRSLCEKEVIKDDASMNPTETGGLNSWLVVISWIILLAIIFFLTRQISTLRRDQSQRKRERSSLNRKKEDELADLNRQLDQMRRQYEQVQERLTLKTKELEEAQVKLSEFQQTSPLPKSDQPIETDRPEKPTEQRAFFGMPKGSGNGFFNDLFDHEDIDAKFKVMFHGASKQGDGTFEPIALDRIQYNDVDSAVVFRGNRENATRMTVVSRGKVRFNPDYDYDRWDIVDPCVVEVN